jgi:hypothetical protein
MRRHLPARFDGDKAERARNKFIEILALIDARDRASRFAESGRKATRRMMYSIIIRSEEIGKESEEVIGRPRNPRMRRSRQLPLREAKRPLDGSRASLPAKK